MIKAKSICGFCGHEQRVTNLSEKSRCSVCLRRRFIKHDQTLENPLTNKNEPQGNAQNLNAEKPHTESSNDINN